MFTSDTLEIILAILAFLTVAGVFSLYLQEYKNNHRLLKILYPRLNETERKNRNILKNALQKAQTIIGRAEKEGSKTIAQNRSLAEKMENRYEEEFSAYLHYLKNLSARETEENHLLIQKRTEEVFIQLEKEVKETVRALLAEGTRAINDELTAIKTETAAYKAEQIKIIDDSIADIVEETTALVLGKKISLDEEMDLVYASLEKAKAEKIIV